MRRSDTIAISIALVGVAMPVIAWLAAPEKIDYTVKTILVITAVICVVIAIYLPIRANIFEHRQRKALDELSGEIDWAIHHLLNRPMSSGTSDEWDAFSEKLKIDYDEWCARVDKMLMNKSFFSKSDLIRFQRLGVIEPIRFTGQRMPDHTFSMLKLKLQRLQEVIDLVQQRPW